MVSFGSVFSRGLRRVVRSGLRQYRREGRGGRSGRGGLRGRRRRARRGADSADPGRSGPFATEAVDPATLRAPRLHYAPHTDGDPNPGEVVWTWVPYEEDDGRGKDRPTLVIARETSLTVYAVPLTSSSTLDSNPKGAERIPIGSGAWDARGRESVAQIGRLLRVHHYGMRREATAVPHETYDRVATELRSRHGWG